MSQISSTWRWYEEDPKRLEWELDQLKARGWSFAIDEHEHKQGRVVLRGDVEIEGVSRHLAIVFPFTYPEHRLEIFDLTGDGTLPLHEHPYEHNLCLLDNLPEAWSPRTDSAAFMVARVVELRTAARGGKAALEEIGVGAPEPQSTYYRYARNSSVLVTANLLGIDDTRGKFCFRSESAASPHRGMIAEVRCHGAGKEVRRALPEVAELFSGPSIWGPWFRLPSPPPFLATAEQYRDWAAANVPDFGRAIRERQASTAFKDLQIDSFALVYPDEGPEGEHDAWLVCLLVRQLQGKHWSQPSTALLRPFILEPTDQERRIAPIAAIRDKKIAVVGLGTVGAPLALELGRTGLLGEMLLADYDYYSIGNLVRHPLNIRSLGQSKAEAVAAAIRLSSPLTKLTALDVRLGSAPRTQSGEPDEERLLTLLNGMDLIIDATADGGTSRFLNRFSQGNGIPLIVAWVTAGGWGGEIVRSMPGKTGCYECYLWQIREGTIPKPSQDDRAEPIFTRGCGFPTFTGAGFDAVAIASDTVRLAAQTLVSGSAAGYSQAPYDVLIRHNRGATEDSNLPRYESYRLGVHPRCPWHEEQSR